ncbi:putative bifunctional diguanylate cyclase/phosphodiesterase [Deefgea salmonis]|uniref:GGDEF domain-containing phosphodiesterase n=1 Tax=Deefgea salmonis TaxID=2875502 RepID=A0ABS8BNV5_9NEIS|nr:GGDEF domain-containing phosphodiesterase [Deefgea salmonis]MCB5197418.1 GGDEF domain-containing phosphodiesterase [Deefgea salmonis]
MPTTAFIDDLNEIETRHIQRLSVALAHTDSGRYCGILHIEVRHRPHRPKQSAVVAQMATALRTMLRDNDQLFHIDHQTLGLLIPNIAGISHALLAANRAQYLLSEAPATQQHLHPHIGIALYPEHGENMPDLLNSARIAARDFAQDQIGVYDPSRDWLGQQLARLEAPLREALAQNRFHLVFQAQINGQSLQIVGAEILLRWDDAVLGQVPPDQIVEVAEHLGLMDTLTRWVIQSGLRQFAVLRSEGYRGSMSLNLCPSNLADKNLAMYIANALEIWGIPANTLVLEITESALIADIDAALKQLEQLKSMGCQLSLDDFGTGYSSLAYLRRLPIDELKIDRSFIQSMAHCDKDAAIVQSMIELAHRLELTVVAEGVEDAVTAAFLQHHQCDTIQGFYYSRPLTLSAFKTYIQSMEQAA